MRIQEQVPLAPLTTFGVGGAASYLIEAHSEADVREAVLWARDEVRLPLFVLGGGSNLLVPDGGYRGVVLQMRNPGCERQGELFDVAAGENWDGFVDQATAAGCAGVECLAGIPGTVGGTPVQNVGAYGQEVAETIESVRAFDTQRNEFADLDHAACSFRYRGSRFNLDEPGRWIVTRVRFRLRSGGMPQLKYADIQRRFVGLETPPLVEVAAAVRTIRQAKGMLLVPGDPDVRSAGSFFKNPVVDGVAFERVVQASGLDLKAIPHWPAAGGQIKLAAAWLLERAGFVKGFGDGPVGISSRHTLALVNRGGATYADVESFQQRIVGAVDEMFGVRLEREPVLLR